MPRAHPGHWNIWARSMLGPCRACGNGPTSRSSSMRLSALTFRHPPGSVPGKDSATKERVVNRRHVMRAPIAGRAQAPSRIEPVRGRLLVRQIREDQPDESRRALPLDSSRQGDTACSQGDEGRVRSPLAIATQPLFQARPT